MQKVIKSLFGLMILFQSVISFSSCTPNKNNTQPLTPEQVAEITFRAIDYQLEHPVDTPIGDWIYGPFINSLVAAGKMNGGEKYIQEAISIGQQENWGVITTWHRANDFCTPQTWIELYEILQKEEMLLSIKSEMDQNMAKVALQDTNLAFIDANRDKWSWCDALFMAPPALARLGKVTGDIKYLDFMNRWWGMASRYYYDQEEQLFFRDESYFNQREPNGEKVFWSRGNGWVIGGLVRVLQYLPKDDPNRPGYEQQLQEMLTRIVSVQRADGLWSSGLLDTLSYPQAETSGSAFFVYGLAYAMNEGILEKTEFQKSTEKAWVALCTYVDENGKFTGVQPIGDAPLKYDQQNSMPYGVGAFVLAGSEMYRLLGGQVKEFHSRDKSLVTGENPFN